MKKFLVVLLALVAITSLAGNVLLYKRYSSQRPLMTIGPERIQIGEYRDKLDYEFGKATLNKMAYTMLILQEAKKANVLPTDADVDERIAAIERRVPKALEEARGNTHKMAELKRNLRAEIALENLTIKDVKVSDAEIRAFYDKNKALFQVPTQARTTIVLAQNAVDAASAAALLKNKSMTPQVIANQPRLAVIGINGFNPNWNALPVDGQAKLGKAIMATPVQGVTTVQVGNHFFVARIDGRANSGIEAFQKVRPTLERAVRLKKAEPREVVLARLYKGAQISFEVGKYAAYFQDIEKLGKSSAATEGKLTANSR
jgi:foldase protein PrsA